MSIKGHPYRWFTAALKRRDLAGVKAAAAELEHVTLTDALSIVVLMAERRDRALDRPPPAGSRAWSSNTERSG